MLIELMNLPYNRRTNVPISYDMLVGGGHYFDVGTQIDYPELAYSQINECALKAWKRLPTSGSRTEELSKIRQGPDEPYQDFVSHLLKAVSRLVVDGEAGTLIVKQLAYENANSACQTAIRPWRKTGTLEDYIKLCAEIGLSYIQGVTLAAIMKGIHPQEMQRRLQKQRDSSDPVCFQCGKPGHFRARCPDKKNVSTEKGLKSGFPTNICPRCQRGYHWANECRSKTDRFGNILPGNGKRGQLRPQQIMAAQPMNPSELTLPISPELTSYSAVPPPAQG